MSVMPLALLAFFSFGLLLVLPGALQPEFARAYALDLGGSGAIASALMLGVGVGVIGSGPLVDHFARRPLFVGAALACAGALAAAAAAHSFAALLAALALLGAAGGAFETLLNAAVPESQPATAAARLTLVHAAATLGAALGAPLLARGASAFGLASSLGALAVWLAALALAGAFARFPAPPSWLPRERAVALPLAALAPLALASAAYVGVETAFAVILPPLALARGLAAPRGALAISGFWAGVFIARIGFARLALPARPRQLALGAGVAALLLAAGALADGRALELWSAAIGFALGVVFPVLVVLAGDTTPQRRATALALVVAAGSVGGFVVPLAAGRAGASGAPLVLAASCALAMLGALLARRA